MGTKAYQVGGADRAYAARTDRGHNRRFSAIDGLRLLLIAGCAVFGFTASPASANVFEVSPDGQVSVRQGAGAAVFEAVGAKESPATDLQVDAIFPSAAMTVSQGVAVPQRYAGLVQVAAASANISPALLAALVWQESGWNPQAVSSKGAVGLAQLMPGTARDLGVDPRDPVGNLTGGARYLRQLLDSFGGDVEKALAAYNAGAGRVRRANGIPAIAETQAYVRSIVQRVSSVRQEVR